jgi:gluconate 2-dehydrogenase
MSMMAAENAVAAIEGRRPPNLLNPEVWEVGRASTPARGL